MRILIRYEANDEQGVYQTFDFFIEMPCRLNKGDYILMWYIIKDDDKIKLSEEQKSIIELHEGEEEIMSISWEKDEIGIYQIASIFFE